MIVFLNGRFVAEEAAMVPAGDRGFCYGDGVFETLRVARGLPFQWDAHLQRLARGAELLGILPPLTPGEMRLAAARLVALNAMPDAVLRLTLTRGSGPRGYSPKGANSPTLVMTLHPAPRRQGTKLPRARLITASFRVAAGDPLSAVKTCNKLPQILARAEAEAAGADDALLLNTRGEVAGATAGNVFWLAGTTLCTPPLSAGALDGITGATVLALGRRTGLKVRERTGHARNLLAAAGVFLTNSVAGLTEVSSLDGRALRRSPVVARLARRYWELLQPSAR